MADKGKAKEVMVEKTNNGVFPHKPKSGSVFPKEQKSVKAMAVVKMGKIVSSSFKNGKKKINPQDN
ncbi:hypothetical protein P3S67_010514 [Capsicum chacoense]